MLSLQLSPQISHLLTESANLIKHRHWKQAIKTLDELFTATGGTDNGNALTEFVYQIAGLLEDIDETFTP